MNALEKITEESYWMAESLTPVTLKEGQCLIVVSFRLVYMDQSNNPVKFKWNLCNIGSEKAHKL